MPFSPRDYEQAITRRHLLSQTATGIGSIALGSLLNQDTLADATHVTEPRAKRVIFLFQSGGPSQFETFDHKPELNKRDGELMPEEITAGQRLAQIRGHELRIVGSKYRFARYGESGTEVSELLPHTAKIVDDITVIRSLQTDAINHDPAVTFMQTGHTQPGRPSFGAWTSYGLGSENADLPAFVVLPSGMDKGQPLHSRYWSNGFLPGQHQGTLFRPHRNPVFYLSNPPGISADVRRRQLDGLAAMNQIKSESVGDPEIAARIAAFELAYRMQMSIPNLMGTADETETSLDMYGEDVRTPGTYASNCLMARRLAERGVRFIQLYHRGWDQHTNLERDIANQCRSIDQPSAALIRDLKERGLLEDTLVIWAGEFGRTPMLQAAERTQAYGRDHHMKCFSIWLAGGGIRAGKTIGESDELGYSPTKDPIHVHDLHATVLHCLGIDHTELTYRSLGRDFRLTDIAGNVRKKLLLS